MFVAVIIRRGWRDPHAPGRGLVWFLPADAASCIIYQAHQVQRAVAASSGSQASGEQRRGFPCQAPAACPRNFLRRKEKEELRETGRSPESAPARVLMEPRLFGTYPQVSIPSSRSGAPGRPSRHRPQTHVPTPPRLGGPCSAGRAEQLAGPLGGRVSRGWTGKVTQSGRGAFRASLPRSAAGPPEGRSGAGVAALCPAAPSSPGSGSPAAAGPRTLFRNATPSR